jgi:hypothetical protein
VKTGTPFNDVLASIKATHESKRDYVADTRALQLTTDKEGSLLTIEGLPEGEPTGTFGVTPHSHGQLRQRLDIPSDYYKRLQCDKGLHGLLDTTVNTLLHNDPQRRLVRTLNGNVRAFLTDRYQVVDNWDIVMTVLPEMQELADRHGCMVQSCEITDHRLYLKLMLPGISYSLGKITEGEYRGMDDVLHPMLYIQNSETGSGSVSIHPGIFRLVCTNGLVIEEAALTMAHVTRGVRTSVRGKDTSSYTVERLLSDETKQAEDTAFLLKVRDVMRAAVSSLQFENLVQQFGETRNLQVPRPKLAVEVVAQRHNLTAPEGEAILERLINGGDLSMFGLVNAVTRAAEDARDYERATELEELGGKIMARAGDLHREMVRLAR